MLVLIYLGEPALKPVVNQPVEVIVVRVCQQAQAGEALQGEPEGPLELLGLGLLKSIEVKEGTSLGLVRVQEVLAHVAQLVDQGIDDFGYIALGVNDDGDPVEAPRLESHELSLGALASDQKCGVLRLLADSEPFGEAVVYLGDVVVVREKGNAHPLILEALAGHKVVACVGDAYHLLGVVSPAGGESWLPSVQ